MPGVGRGKSGRSNSKLRAGSSELDALPKHVTQHVDPDTKETYYHDSHSRTVSWQRPVDPSWDSSFTSANSSFQDESKSPQGGHQRCLDSQHIAVLAVSGGGMLTACVLDTSIGIRIAVAGAFFVLQLVLMLHHNDKQQREADGLREHSQSVVVSGVQQVSETYEPRESKSASRENAGQFATNPTIPVKVPLSLAADRETAA